MLHKTRITFAKIAGAIKAIREIDAVNLANDDNWAAGMRLYHRRTIRDLIPEMQGQLSWLEDYLRLDECPEAD